MARPSLAFLLPLLAFASIADASPGVVNPPLPRSIVARAPECAPLFKGGLTDSPTSNVWEAAKTPALSQHCDLLLTAGNHVRTGRFAEAIEAARKAEALTPGNAGPWVVRGQALARWGKGDEAIVAFEKAKSIHPRALDDAEALDDYGAVLVAAKRLEDARKAYRALLPRAHGLCSTGDCDASALAYLTAGELAMAVGPSTIDEAIAVLREARAKSDAGKDLRRVSTMALALALDRRGDAQQAAELDSKVVAAEVPIEFKVRFIAPEDAQAMRALALEGSDPALALEQWRAFLASGGDKGLWAAHAKQHVAKLEKPGTKKAT